MEPRYLDPTNLPFTENEISRALALTSDEQEARDAAHVLSETLSGGTYEGAWSVSDEVFASLAMLSDDLRERVDAYILARCDDMRPTLVKAALRREGLSPGVMPTPTALRAAEEEIASYVADWQRGCAALTEWVRRRQAGEPVGAEPPLWPGQDAG